MATRRWKPRRKRRRKAKARRRPRRRRKAKPRRRWKRRSRNRLQAIMKAGGIPLPFSFMRLLFFLLLAFPALAQPLPTVQLNAGIHLIRAELAGDFTTRMTGLMHRPSMPQNAGMLFVFDEKSVHCMWMKNTLI